jgi:hypothetical protein
MAGIDLLDAGLLTHRAIGLRGRPAGDLVPSVERRIGMKNGSTVVALVLALCAGVPAQAITYRKAEAVGWSRDGAYFVCQHGQGSGRDRRMAVSGTAGEAVTFKTQEEFEAWASVHPLAEEVWSASESEDGTVKVGVEANKEGYQRLDWGAKKDLLVRTFIQRDGARLPSAVFRVAPPKEKYGTIELVVAPYWSPDSTRVAWMLSLDESWPTGGGDFNADTECRVAIDRLEGPRIQVVGKGLSDADFTAAIRRLEEAGFAPTSRAESEVRRTRTVVYSGKAYRADAKKIATALAGGTAVEDLTWKSTFDVVVALGKPD